MSYEKLHDHIRRDHKANLSRTVVNTMTLLRQLHHEGWPTCARTTPVPKPYVEHTVTLTPGFDELLEHLATAHLLVASPRAYNYGMACVLHHVVAPECRYPDMTGG